MTAKAVAKSRVHRVSTPPAAAGAPAAVQAAILAPSARRWTTRLGNFRRVRERAGAGWRSAVRRPGCRGTPRDLRVRTDESAWLRPGLRGARYGCGCNGPTTATRLALQSVQAAAGTRNACSSTAPEGQRMQYGLSAGAVTSELHMDTRQRHCSAKCWVVAPAFDGGDDHHPACDGRQIFTRCTCGASQADARGARAPARYLCRDWRHEPAIAH